MATIRKRENSYQIRVSCGYTADGKQVVRTKTWKPDKKMTPKQIEKELNRQAVMFEEACMNGFMTSSIKFSEFAEIWFKEYAEKQLKPTTVYVMDYRFNRINEEIGHLRLDKINKRIIQSLIQSLINGNDKYKPLCPQTVKGHITFVSSVLNYAVNLDMLSSNPCNGAILPPLKKSNRKMYTLEEAQLFIDTLIKKAPLVYQCYFILMIYTGFRRGEICGLTWDDIDFNNHIITINKARNNVVHKGDIIDTPKTSASNRSLRVVDEVFVYLKRLREYYEKEKNRLGTKWQDNNFVFKGNYGKAIYVRSPEHWLRRFCEYEGLEYVTPHSFRHLNASLLIDSGANIKTVQACLGHSDANTTLNIYAHSFAKAQAKASEAVASNFKLL